MNNKRYKQYTTIQVTPCQNNISILVSKWLLKEGALIEIIDASKLLFCLELFGEHIKTPFYCFYCIILDLY